MRATGLEIGREASLLFGTAVAEVLGFKDELLMLVESVDLDVLVVVELFGMMVERDADEVTMTEDVTVTEAEEVMAAMDEAADEAAEDTGAATPPVKAIGPQ